MFVTPHNYLSTPTRIISLVPSLTEYLYSIGLTHEVVGITKFCLHPDGWFRTKPRVGGTKQIHFEIIDELKPDLIIANKEENNKEDIEKLALSYNVLLTDINSYKEALHELKNIGQVVGKTKEAEKIIQNIICRFDDLEFSERYKALYLIWQEPFMSVGRYTFISSVLEKAGFINVLNSEDRYPVLSIEKINQLRPEFVILSSEPFPFTEKHIKSLQPLLPYSKIILADGEMFSWYGSRMQLMPDYFRKFRKAQVDF